MRLILATRGTLGDHLPMVGLGCALQERGLPVRLACNSAMHGVAQRSGLPVLTLGEALGPSQAAACPLAWDHWQRPPAQVRWTAEVRERTLNEILALRELLRPGDVLIGTRNLPLQSLVARERRCRLVEVGLNAGSMIDYDRLAAQRLAPHPWQLGLERLEVELRKQWLAGAPRSTDPPPMVRLQAVPASFVPRDYPQLPCVATGFWCWVQPEWVQWSPPYGLKRILSQGCRPLALAFSSQPLADASRVLAVHLQVAERLSRPLVLVKGWAFAANDTHTDLLSHPALLTVDALPFDWLFPRVHGVFIHGGMGTLAAALRAGCRVVIEPHGNDQFLNARLALQQGLALAVHPHRFQPAEVAEAILHQPAPAGLLAPQDFRGLDQAVKILLELL